MIFFENREVVIFNVKGDFFAVENLCPHRGGPLSEGEISGGVVTCPWHGARFDIKTGKGLKGPHRSNITAYQVKIAGTELKLASHKS